VRSGETGASEDEDAQLVLRRGIRGESLAWRRAERRRAEGDGGVEEIATLQAHRRLRQRRFGW
jgi:hypothetical protein